MAATLMPVSLLSPLAPTWYAADSFGAVPAPSQGHDVRLSLQAVFWAAVVHSAISNCSHFMPGDSAQAAVDAENNESADDSGLKGALGGCCGWRVC